MKTSIGLNGLQTEQEKLLEDTLPVVQQLLEGQRWQEASDICHRLIGAVPDNPQLLYFGGVSSFNCGHFDASEAQFSRLAELVPTLTEAHVNLAQLAHNRGDIEAAIGRLEAATGADPSNEQALMTLALWQLYLGRVAEGRATLSNAYAVNPGNATAERVLRALSAGETARTAPGHEQRVVLISDSPRVREAKLGRAILSQGWEVYLLSLSAESDAATEHFTAVIHCADAWDAVIRATELRPLVYHCLSQMKYETAAAFAAANPGPVLGDFYDQVDMLGEAMLAAEPIRNFDRTLERSVMARLDGHVCRSFESQLAVRRENAVDPAPRIFFPDYGWGDIDPLPKLHEQDGELHVVYAGAMWVEKKFPHLNGDGGYLWLGELLTRHRVHMHVYPSSSSAADSDGTYDQYRELAAASPYFHLHDTVRDGRAFIREISQYDVGLTVYKSIVDGGIPQFYNKWKLALAASNKLADYVDANLRFMINPECCVYKLARHYGMAVAATADLYDGAFWEGLKQQVLNSDLEQTAAKKYWGLGYNAPRLIRFYEQMGRRRA